MKNLYYILPFLFFFSCTNDDDSGPAVNNSGKPQVYVSNYPLKYFAERLGGDKIDVHFPAAGKGDPAYWKPTDADVENMQTADLILLNGATYEKWIDHVTLPGSIQIDTSMDLAAWYIEVEEGPTHSHGDGGEHSHKGTAFTTWLDFTQAQQQMRTIVDALNELPAFSSSGSLRDDKLLHGDLTSLDLKMQEVAKQIGDQPLLASHPIYQYMARHYELKIESVLWEPDVVPNDEAMAELQLLLEKHQAKWMIWENEPTTGSVKKLEALGIKSVVFNPCANEPEEGDFLSVMKQNIENLKSIQ
ncbi:MAG: metal ABC transporter substrate-binding protein [Verrucomicrobiota bacterium]